MTHRTFDHATLDWGHGIEVVQQDKSSVLFFEKAGEKIFHGRLHRLHPGKTEVQLYDYVDREVPMLLRMFEKRLRGYRAIGYARGEAPLGFAEPRDDLVVEYDEETVARLEAADEFE